MRLSLVAGCSLSLLLGDLIPATAQQRSLTCGQREQQIKSSRDEVDRLTAHARAIKFDCTDRRESCGAYGEALVRQREKERELEGLTKDPAWQACQAYLGPRNLNYTRGSQGSGNREAGSGSGNEQARGAGSSEGTGRSGGTGGGGETGGRGSSGGSGGSGSFGGGGGSGSSGGGGQGGFGSGSGSSGGTRS